MVFQAGLQAIRRVTKKRESCCAGTGVLHWRRAKALLRDTFDQDTHFKLRTGDDHMLSRRATIEGDLRTFQKMKPVLDDLWHASRLLADIDMVWPGLSDTERDDILQSRTRKDRFHEKVAEGKIAELLEMSRGIQSFKYRKFREDLLRHLKHWDSREPDQIKIFAAKMTAEIGS
ncbi:MAG: hypothetical protein IID08_05905 [Candidatus Hydrogenedentes bacterium]|nr:hypothetical protein [Candidatus Hydrogenedentota bacterium]